MIIRDVDAVWLSCPIPYEKQHVSDFGRLSSFDMTLVTITTEGRPIAELAATYQLELAPRCWGSAFSFMAGVSLAFASPSAIIIEFSLGTNPLLHDLVDEPIIAPGGKIDAPQRPDLGITPRADFIVHYRR
jgi:D-galactarolactone cycloisomerase